MSNLSSREGRLGSRPRQQGVRQRPESPRVAIGPIDAIPPLLTLLQ